MFVGQEQQKQQTNKQTKMCNAMKKQTRHKREPEYWKDAKINNAQMRNCRRNACAETGLVFVLYVVYTLHLQIK